MNKERFVSPILRSFAILAAAACWLTAPDPAAAAGAPRTYVSAQGNDANPCSLVAPCRSLSAGLAATVSFGELIMIDSVGYGTATITQSVSIISPPGVSGRITSNSGAAITVNGAGITVNIEGVGIDLLQAGTIGVLFQNGARLSVDHMEINGPGGGGNGIDNIRHNAPNGVIAIANTVLRGGNNCFIAEASSPASPALATIVNSRAEGCYFGFVAHGSSIVMISRSTAVGSKADSGHCYADFIGLGDANGQGILGLDGVVATNCAAGVTAGPLATGGNAMVTISDSVVTGNNVGLSVYGASTGRSFGDNRVFGNVTDGSFASALTKR